MTQTLPDNSTIVSVLQPGRLQSVTRKDSTGAQIGKTTYGYDAFGRQNSVIDARNGATTFTFNNAAARHEVMCLRWKPRQWKYLLDAVRPVYIEFFTV